MEKIDKFIKELEQALSYSEDITVYCEDYEEEYDEKMYKVYIFNCIIINTETLKVLAKWNVYELLRNSKGDYEIFINIKK